MKERAKRMMQSKRARAKRKSIKEIRNRVLEKYYAHMRSLRKKYNKIKNRHHESKDVD